MRLFKWPSAQTGVSDREPVRADQLTSRHRPRLHARRLFVALAASIGVFASAQAASAAIYVRGTGDSRADGGALRTAVINAPPGETIYVGPGLFSPDAPIDLTKNVTIVGSAADTT